MQNTFCTSSEHNSWSYLYSLYENEACWKGNSGRLCREVDDADADNDDVKEE